MSLFTLFSLYLIGASALVLPSASASLRYKRIVGGVETIIEDRPFSASIQFFYNSDPVHMCGASILNNKHLLTSARCTRSVTPLYARVGSTNFKSGGQLVLIIKQQVHPLFDRWTYDYDFAVMTIDTTLEFGPTIAPVVLPTSPADDPKENEMGTASGWGNQRDSPYPIYPSNLFKVDLPAWDNERCKSVYSFITPRHICFGGTPQGGTSTCDADDGGPITFNGIQVAVISNTYSCHDRNIPGFNNRISSALDWIKEQAELE